MAVLGALITALGAIKLWRLDPESKEYSLTVGFIAGVPSKGLVNYLNDQKRALTIVVVGGCIQLVATILALFA